MIKFSSSVASCLATFALVAAAQAVTVYVVGDTGGPKAIGETGQLQILIDIAPENTTFGNSALTFKVNVSQPSVIAFSGAEVDNRNLFGQNIWSLAGVEGLEADSIADIWSASVSSQALNPGLAGNPIVDGGTEFLYATIDYEVVGGGSTRVQVDKSDRFCPVCYGGVLPRPPFVYVPSEPIIGVPEPTSLVLLTLGLIGGLVPPRLDRRGA